MECLAYFIEDPWLVNESGVIYCIKVGRQSSQKLSNPPSNGQDICHTALEIITGISSAVIDGSVTVSLLEKMNGKQANMQKLYAAVSHASSVFNRTLSSRLNEYNTFVSQQGQLSTLVQELQSANISGESDNVTLWPILNSQVLMS